MIISDSFDSTRLHTSSVSLPPVESSGSASRKWLLATSLKGLTMYASWVGRYCFATHSAPLVLLHWLYFAFCQFRRHPLRKWQQTSDGSSLIWRTEGWIQGRHRLRLDDSPFIMNGETCLKTRSMSCSNVGNFTRRRRAGRCSEYSINIAVRNSGNSRKTNN